MGVKKAAGSFFAGLILTIVLVVVVPVIIDTYITGYIQDTVGDTEILFLSPSVISQILVWLVMLAFLFFLGAGGILRHFGVLGIVGLVVAYWLLGDVTKAILPLVFLSVALVFSHYRKKKKEEKKKAKEEGKKGTKTD